VPTWVSLFVGLLFPISLFMIRQSKVKRKVLALLFCGFCSCIYWLLIYNLGFNSNIYDCIFGFLITFFFLWVLGIKSVGQRDRQRDGVRPRNHKS
jgi:hypothetical protein